MISGQAANPPTAEVTRREMFSLSSYQEIPADAQKEPKNASACYKTLPYLHFVFSMFPGVRTTETNNKQNAHTARALPKHHSTDSLRAPE